MKLFIAGIPGSGKTPFADWLRDDFGFMHVDFELLSSDYQQFLSQHQGNLHWFVEEMSRFSRCVVASWGFPIEALPNVQTLSGSDVRLIWFDGNREVACKAWMRKTGKPEAEFRRQVAAIDTRITEIRSLFRDGWIEVIGPDGTRLSFPQILDRLSIQPRFRKI
jgi:shikimate kinase